MKIMKKRVTVFGSAFPKDGEEEYSCAYHLGKLLAQKGFDVNTGGYRGIMEAVSKGVSENGGEATGITLSYVKNQPNVYLNRNIICDSLFERISKLVELGDAYIILRGGTGTLLEFATVWEYLNKNLMEPKPVACHSLMWKEIGTIVNKQLEKEGREINRISFFEDINEMVEFISNNLQH
jgi:uncharacterized protein (TIGR00725 family)